MNENAYFISKMELFLCSLPVFSCLISFAGVQVVYISVVMLMAEMGAHPKSGDVLVGFLCKYASQHFSMYIMPEKNSVHNM